jgi:hypothetical protein
VEAVVDEGAKVRECACEANKSTCNSEGCCLGKVVVCNVVAFRLSWFPYLIVVGGRGCNALLGHLGTGSGGGGLDDWGGDGCGGGE